MMARTPRRQRLAAHLHRCGPRPVLEALLAVDAGQDLDYVLEDFGRLDPEICKALGGNEYPGLARMLTVIGGGIRS